MFHKRLFKPLHPEKYTGDPTNIIMRSSWETRFASWCDKNPSILKWNSEETVIPYRCPTDDKIHRYFVDFYVKIKVTNASSQTVYETEINLKFDQLHFQNNVAKKPQKSTKKRT